MNKEQYLQRFKEVTEKMLAITKAKNSDYSHGENPFRNFEAVETFGIKTAHGFITRMTDKLMRISNIIEKGDCEVKDEKIEDTLLDLSNYSILFMLWLEGGNNNTLKEQEEE